VPLLCEQLEAVVEADRPRSTMSEVLAGGPSDLELAIVSDHGRERRCTVRRPGTAEPDGTVCGALLCVMT
jgi:hypothetical protein